MNAVWNVVNKIESDAARIRFITQANEFLAKIDKLKIVYISRQDFGDDEKEEWAYCLSQTVDGKWVELWFGADASAPLRFCVENGLQSQSTL